MTNTLSRRRLLKASAVSLASTVVPAFGVQRAVGSPNERLNVAVIGFGQRGHHVLRGFWLPARERGEVNIVGIADPNLKSGHDWIGTGNEPWHDWRIAEVDKQVASVPRFQDYRVMLDKMGEDIDGILIFAVCNNHFPASMQAMQRGKHVFVEKPMCMTVEEARRMRLEASRQKVVTQMGVQGHGNGGPRMLREWVRNGLLGDIREVHSTGGRPPYAQRPRQGDPVRETLDYDTWLGPAAEGPFHKSFITRRGWCAYHDFTIGSWGETFIHSFEGAFCGLDVKSPRTVSLVEEPGGEAIVLAYPARGDLPPVKFVFHQGHGPQANQINRLPFPEQMDLEARKRLLSHHSFAHVFVPGTKYTAYIQGYSTVRILPYESMREFANKHGRLDGYGWPGGHYGSFLAACKAGNPEASPANFEYAGPLMETICLLNVVSRIRKKGKILEWDAENVRFRNDKDANQLIRRAYRK